MFQTKIKRFFILKVIWSHYIDVSHFNYFHWKFLKRTWCQFSIKMEFHLKELTHSPTTVILHNEREKNYFKLYFKWQNILPTFLFFFNKKQKHFFSASNKRVNDYFLQGHGIKGHEYVLKADISGAHTCIMELFCIHLIA